MVVFGGGAGFEFILLSGRAQARAGSVGGKGWAFAFSLGVRKLSPPFGDIVNSKIPHLLIDNILLDDKGKQMDIDALPADSRKFNKTVNINASTSQVWHILTTPELMKKWMISDDIEIHIITDWKVGNPMVIRGNMNGKNFENMGTVLQFEPEKALEYSHLSSMSRLPDRSENYSIVGFRLAPTKDQTVLTLTLSNFPTESIYKHLAFYWNVTLEVLKKTMEKQG